LFIFVSVWFAFIFFVKENFPRQTETITLLLFIHKHGAFFFYSHQIFSFNLSYFFFKRCDSLFYPVVIVYFRKIQLIIPVYFGKKTKFFKKITVFLLFSSLFMSNTQKLYLLHFRNSK